MRTLLAFAACAGFAMAQASTPASTVPLVNTITTTILSTTSTVVSTSISTVSTSSCSTSTGTDGQATATCKSSFALQPVEVYGQAVVMITTSIVTTTGYSTIYAAAAGSQTQTQSQTSVAASTPTVPVTGTSAYSSPATFVSSTGTTSHATADSQSSTSTTKLAASSSSIGAASSPASNSSTQSHQSSGTSPGTIAAIVIAVFLGLALLGVGAFFFRRRQTKSGARGIPRITLDAEKGKSISLDRATGAAVGKSDTCSETTGLTHSAPPTPSTPRDGFPDDVQDRYEMCTTPSRVHEMDARPTYSPFPPRRGK